MSLLPIKAFANHPMTRAVVGSLCVMAGVSIVQTVAREQDERIAELGQLIADREAQLAAGAGVTLVDDVDQAAAAVRAAVDQVPVDDVEPDQDHDYPCGADDCLRCRQIRKQ